MKKIVFLAACAILSLTSLQTLSAFSVGREGSPFEYAGIMWHNVKYEDSQAGYVASLPGEPKSGVSGQYIFSASAYENTDYEIHVSMTGTYSPPKKEKDFLNEVTTAFKGKGAKISPLLVKPANVVYAAEIIISDDQQITRIYCSKNKLYWAIVKGEDLQYAKPFFNSVKIAR